MSAKPIDEFLQECTGWLEKIAAAKQREETAYAVINSVQMEKKALPIAIMATVLICMVTFSLLKINCRGLAPRKKWYPNAVPEEPCSR